MQLSPAEFEAVRRTQTLDFADERLVNRSGHARTVIEVSRTEDDLSSQAGVNADEVADERALGTAPTSTLPSTASKSKVVVSIKLRSATDVHIRRVDQALRKRRRRGTAGAQIPGTRRLYEDTDGHRGATI